jgi:hypothetical protein
MANANNFVYNTKQPQIHLLFTDPFEDTDDLFTIMSVLNQVIESNQAWSIVTANEIVDKQGMGLRAMALSQWLYNLIHKPDSPLRQTAKVKLQTAINSNQLQIIQGLTSKCFSQDFERYQQTGKGDPHFYAMSLVKQHYDRSQSMRPFLSILELRQRLLTDKAKPKLSILGIASANDIATLFLGKPKLFEDTFVGSGQPQTQIKQARKYYQQKLSTALATHQQSPQAQRLAKQVKQIWQMSGGFKQQEEYNESLSRIANDYLNFAFNAPIHGLTPINTTRLLHPMLEFLKQDNQLQFPVDEQLSQMPFIMPLLRENLFGSSDYEMPGYYNKYTNLKEAHTLNHDLLAWVESLKPSPKKMRCKLVYAFTQHKQQVKRSYECIKENELLINWVGKDTFTLAVSQQTQAILNNPQAAKASGFIVNQITDSRLIDTLHRLFPMVYGRVGR